ncbi:MAG: glycosyltransferase [Shimia sp.]
MQTSPPQPPTPPPEPITDARLAVVIAAFNGATYLPAQLDSLLAQTARPGLILVGDDGSTDGTRAVLDAYVAHAAEQGVSLRIVDGPRQGAAAHFLYLLSRLPETTTHAAFCDQDDVWRPDRLEAGMAALAEAPGPALACGPTLECGPDLQPYGCSRIPDRAPSFGHALVQSIAGGNTMLMNRAALDLMQAAQVRIAGVVVHDWWAYQLIAGAGGQVLFDPAPRVLYRQHEGNVIGANRGLWARVLRARMLLTGRFRDWNATNLAALLAVEGMLTPRARAQVADFAALRDTPRRAVLRRMRLARRIGLTRGGPGGGCPYGRRS